VPASIPVQQGVGVAAVLVSPNNQLEQTFSVQVYTAPVYAGPTFVFTGTGWQPGDLITITSNYFEGNSSIGACTANVGVSGNFTTFSNNAYYGSGINLYFTAVSQATGASVSTGTIAL
jgi:hypothetical protein